MNRQEIYEKVREHLLAQNAKSMNKHRVCMYRGEEGRKCAIGCLISDENYSGNLEGHGIGSYIVNKTLKKELGEINYEINYIEDDIKFLIDLQQIHDGWEVKDWKEKLNKFGEDWKLEN